MGYGSSTSMSKPTTSKPATNKLSDKQKADLKRHMDKHKDLKDLTPSQLKSHRAKMVSRMKRGMSLVKAHKQIMGK